jgi:uncharacterized protein (DUF2336 family)
MMVRSYLAWSLNASAAERAEAVGILADVFLNGELSAQDRSDAEAALMLALDDPAASVRRALAQTLGASDRAPRPVITALARDLPDIATMIVANSPLLTDAVLVDLLAAGDDMVQIAIAQRPHVSAAIGAAMAEVAGVDACVALLGNDLAEIPLFSLNRLIDRFPDSGLLREALLERDDLPADIRLLLVSHATEHLTAFARDCGWLSGARADRLARDCAESSSISVIAEAADDEMMALVARLRDIARLTPQLLLRSLLSGETRLLTAALSDLAAVPHAKAAGLVHQRSGMGFRALYRKAGMPQRLEPAFEAALSAYHEGESADSGPGRLSCRMIERVLTSLAALEQPELDSLMALLTRLHADAARDAAREAIIRLMLEPGPFVELATGDLDQRMQVSMQMEFRQAA